MGGNTPLFFVGAVLLLIALYAALLWIVAARAAAKFGEPYTRPTIGGDRRNGSSPFGWAKFQPSGVVVIDCAAELPGETLSVRPFPVLLLRRYREGDLVLGVSSASAA